MAKPLSKEKREDIIFHKKAGKENKVIAEFMRVCVRTVERVWKLFNDTNSIEPKPQNSGRKPMVTQEIMNKVINKIKEQPDITLQELIDLYALGISQSALCRRLIKEGLTLKKRRSILKNRTEKILKKKEKNSKTIKKN